MNRNAIYAATAALAVAGLLLAATVARAAGERLIDTPELVVDVTATNITCAMPGEDYADFALTDDAATYRLLGYELPAGRERVAQGGISTVAWEPADAATLVTIEFSAPPLSNMITAVPGTADRRQTPQVIAGFGFDPAASARHTSPVLGSRQPGQAPQADPHGAYELPEFPPVKYSDALVTLKVHNADFREVLWLMSEIGRVSIVLDPYWADEPTGGRRTPGGGADPGSGGGDGNNPGYRPDGLPPTIPREGRGRLTLDFKDVPFDTALELILMSVDLYKVDIYPDSFD
ncbi:hypothetical protein JW859_06660 [bacterium]|nr:hypothetical protein [bacterium]